MQPAGPELSNSSEPAANLPVPSPSACPEAQILPGARCGDLLRFLILHLCRGRTGSKPRFLPWVWNGGREELCPRT